MTEKHLSKSIDPAWIAAGRVLDAISDVDDVALAFDALGRLIAEPRCLDIINPDALGRLVDAVNAELRRRVALVGIEASNSAALARGQHD